MNPYDLAQLCAKCAQIWCSTLFARLVVSQFGSGEEVMVLGVTTGFTAEEIREIVHEYHLQPWGTKQGWLRSRGISRDKIRRWGAAIF